MTDPRPFALSCPVSFTADETVSLAHGGGGLLTRRLIDGLFRPAFGHAPDDLTHDGAILDFSDTRLAFTTDSYVVRPLFFPGGDIGSLAVNGTINDLAMCGATPRFISVGMIMEEGFALNDLRHIVESMRQAAIASQVRIVTGDTKVVERGKGDGLYINTSGVGLVIAPRPIAPQRIEQGDAIIVSGDIARHGISVMAAREGLGFETVITSDCAPLACVAGELVGSGVDVHCLRDLTRGGLAVALNEIAECAGVSMRISERAIPVSDPVRGACEILGLDPLLVACEGRFIAVVAHRDAEPALAALRRHCADAEVIGAVEPSRGQNEVYLETIGGDRPLDIPMGEQLPRIC